MLALSSAKIPPTTTMPWTKLEPDISGVCRIAGTWPMITQPAKAGEHEDVEGDEAADRDWEVHGDVLIRLRPLWRLVWRLKVLSPTLALASAWSAGSSACRACVSTVLARISSSQSILMMLSFIIRASRLYWFLA